MQSFSGSLCNPLKGFLRSKNCKYTLRISNGTLQLPRIHSCLIWYRLETVNIVHGVASSLWERDQCRIVRRQICTCGKLQWDVGHVWILWRDRQTHSWKKNCRRSNPSHCSSFLIQTLALVESLALDSQPADGRCNVAVPKTKRELVPRCNGTTEVRWSNVVVEVATVALKQGNWASDDLMEWLFNPTLKPQKKCQVCGVRHMCVWEQGRWKSERESVCLCTESKGKERKKIGKTDLAWNRHADQRKTVHMMQNFEKKQQQPKKEDVFARSGRPQKNAWKMRRRWDQRSKMTSWSGWKSVKRQQSSWQQIEGPRRGTKKKFPSRRGDLGTCHKQTEQRRWTTWATGTRF